MNDRMKIAREIVRIARSLIAIDIPYIPSLDGQKSKGSPDENVVEKGREKVREKGKGNESPSQSSNKKYEIVNVNGDNRVKALKEFTVSYSVPSGNGLKTITKTIKSGELGGVVAGENSLSQYGSCWVFKDAKITGEAKVIHDAVVTEHAIVTGNAYVTGNAVIAGNAVVSGNASVKSDSGHPYVGGNAKIEGKATVIGNMSGENPVVLGGVVAGSCVISENAKVNAGVVNGNAKIYGNATINGAHVGQGAVVHGKAIAGDGMDIKNAEYTENGLAEKKPSGRKPKTDDKNDGQNDDMADGQGDENQDDDGSKGKGLVTTWHDQKSEKRITPYTEDLETISDICKAQNAACRFVDNGGASVDVFITTEDGVRYTISLVYERGRMYYGLHSDDVRVDERYSLFSNELTNLSEFFGVIFGYDEDEDDMYDDEYEYDDDEDEDDDKDEDGNALDYDDMIKAMECKNATLDFCNSIIEWCGRLWKIIPHKKQEPDLVKLLKYADSSDAVLNSKDYNKTTGKYTLHLCEHMVHADITYDIWLSEDGHKCGLKYNVVIYGKQGKSESLEYDINSDRQRGKIARTIADKICSVHMSVV